MSRDAALNLAKKGFKVFRLDGKIPVTSYLKEATSDPARIAEIWDDLSSDWNVGILCDELLVLDFDVKDGLPGVVEYAAAKADYCADEAFSARTPSGGFHLYFRLPAGVRLANSSKKIGKATDTRSWHGYVAGPGSAGYSWHQGREPDHLIDLPLAPPELIALCEKAPPDRAERHVVDFKQDTEADIERAIEYLTRDAPKAEIGNRDSTTFAVAARLRDFGISEIKCVDLLLDHWNETHLDPPLEPSKIEEDVDHAYRYAKNSPGRDSAEAQFDVVPGVALERPKPAPTDTGDPIPAEWPKATPFILPDEKDIPPRQWLVKGIAARKYVTGLVAPSGSGKTQWLAQLFLATAAGRGEIANVETTGRFRIWSWNQEDDLDELSRRLRAGASAFGVSRADLADRVFLDSGAERALNLVSIDENGLLYRTRYVKLLIEELIAKKIDILVVDPLVEFHEGDEDNKGLHFIGKQFRYIAKMANCAVIFGHHTKKPDGASSDGFAGNADASRGGTALIGITRIMLTLFSMSEKDAKAWNVPQEARGQYVRLDGAKSNISASPRGGRPEWFRWVGRELANGESVGVMEVARLHKAESRVQRINAITDAVVDRVKSHPSGPLRWSLIRDELADSGLFKEEQLKRWMAEQVNGYQTFDGGSLKLTKKVGTGGIVLEWCADENE